MTLSNRSRFADDVVKESTPLFVAQESVLCMDGQKGSARPGSIRFLREYYGSSSREEKRKRNSLLFFLLIF